MPETRITETQGYILGLIMDGWTLKSTHGHEPTAWVIGPNGAMRTVRIPTLIAMSNNQWIEVESEHKRTTTWQITVEGKQRWYEYSKNSQRAQDLYAQRKFKPNHRKPQ